MVPINDRHRIKTDRQQPARSSLSLGTAGAIRASSAGMALCSNRPSAMLALPRLPAACPSILSAMAPGSGNIFTHTWHTTAHLYCLRGLTWHQLGGCTYSHWGQNFGMEAGPWFYQFQIFFFYQFQNSFIFIPICITMLITKVMGGVV